MKNLSNNQKSENKKEGKPKRPIRDRIEPIIIADVVALLVPIAWFVCDPGFDSLSVVIGAIVALLAINAIRNKRIMWVLAGFVFVASVVGFIIVRRANDPEKIVIVGILYDGSKARESDEYVLIRNEDTEPIQLENWTLNDDQSNHVFTFPRYEIQPGQECRIYTNENHPEWCGFNFGCGGSGVWNNKRDTASLRNAEGKLIDQMVTVNSQLDLTPMPVPTLPSSYADLDCLPRDTPREVGLVVDVIDGRTIDVQLTGGSIVRVRYLGVATIVAGQPLFEQSVEINRGLVQGKYATLVEDTTEAEIDDTLLRYVFVEDYFINRWLIAHGYAGTTGDFSCVDDFVNMEMGAAESDSGFYSSEEFMYGNLFHATPSENVVENVAAGSGDLEITDIFFDGEKGNREPDEYVEIKNNGTDTIQLDNWTLSDEANHIFVFPSFVIQPGQSCRVYTNEIHPESCGFSFGNTGSAIWGNKGDCASLRDSENTPIDEYCYP